MATFDRTLVRLVGGTIVLCIVVVVWAAFAFGVVGWPWVRKDVPLLATPEWAGPPAYVAHPYRPLVVRRERVDGEALLFTQDENLEMNGLRRFRPDPALAESPEPYAVYRYDPATRHLSVVPPDAWREATGPIEKSRSMLLGGTPRGSNSFRWADERFAVAGNFIYYGPWRSPSGSKAAVLSADGPKRFTFGSFFGSTTAYWGQHYHQLFSLEDKKFIGEPVRLPFVTADYSIDVCWSPNEEYVVYADKRDSWLVLVPTTKP